MPKSDLKKKKKIKLKGSLNPLREQLNILATEANQLVAQLHESGLSEQSRALSEARRTAIRFHSEDQGQLFTANLPRAVDIGREMARINQFLSDPTSNPRGVMADSVAVAQQLFGGQFRADGGYGANPDYVDEDTAKMVFEIYSRALSTQGGWQRVMGWLGSRSHGLQDYGSENLINAIYDMVINGSDDEIYSSMEDRSGGFLTDEERVNYYAGKASMMIDDMIEESKKMSELRTMGEDYGILQSTEKEQRLRTELWRRKMNEIEREFERTKRK